MTVDETLSHIDANATPVTMGPCLFLGLECDRPLEPSVRLPLIGVQQVNVGRGPERRIAAGRAVDVRLTDPWMSSKHARLAPEDGGWIVEDLGSKNGTLLNGTPIRRSVLADGDVVEVGHALFFFRDNIELRDQTVPAVAELTTFHGQLAAQLDGLARVAQRPHGSVMVSGESGTGKELVARAFHRLSKRSGAFVALNCGSLPPSLFEAELFGYRRGAFSGALEDRIGLVRAADGGTLFLDEIGDLGAPSQAAMLRVLQEHEVQPLGATKPIAVDLRVVTATHRDLAALVTTGEFRADLLARLSGLRVVMPPLRERREDLGLIIASLIRKLAPEPGAVKLTGKTARAIYRHPWPLNIRELEKAMATGLALAGDEPLDLEHLPDDIQNARPNQVTQRLAGLSEQDRRRRDELIGLLRTHDGNVARVAQLMGKAPMQIHRWSKRFGIELDDFRRGR